MMQCIILEDEKSAREVLQSYIEKTPFIQCLGFYESGLDIPPKLLEQADILFLDIQLPEINGLNFLKTLGTPPRVICTTAYSKYAVAAFEEAVTDYLVKPFSYERFFKAVTRVREQLSRADKKRNERLFLYADKTMYAVFTKEILYVKAEVDYVKVVTPKQEILILDSLRNWTEKLQGLPFVQVHRSYIVNTQYIQKVYGNQIFIGTATIPIGKTFRAAFFQAIA